MCFYNRFIFKVEIYVGGMVDEEIGQRVFEQVMNIWAIPEMEKRRKEGILKDGFEIRRIQVIFTLGKSPEIKFNEDVVITAIAKATRDIIKGEDVKDSDIGKIKKFIVDYPSDSGHITLFRFLDKWIVIFDARYNKERIKELIKRSKEYYESAKADLDNNRLRPFYENCWNSAELSAVCHSLCIGGKIEGHGKNIRNFVKWSELENVDKKHAEIFSQLNGLRGLKYDCSMEPGGEDPNAFLESVEGMIKEAEMSIRD